MRKTLTALLASATLALGACNNFQSPTEPETPAPQIYAGTTNVTTSSGTLVVHYDQSTAEGLNVALSKLQIGVENAIADFEHESIVPNFDDTGFNRPTGHSYESRVRTVRLDGIEIFLRDDSRWRGGGYGYYDGNTVVECSKSLADHCMEHQMTHIVSRMLGVMNWFDAHHITRDGYQTLYVTNVRGQASPPQDMWGKFTDSCNTSR